MTKEEAKEKSMEVALDLMKSAKANLQKDGELIPVAILDTPQGLGMIPLKFIDPDQKMEEILKIAVAAEAFAATQVYFITDVWVSKRLLDTPPEKIAEVIPSQDPNRREAIVVSFKSREFTGCVAQEYERKKGKVEFVGEPEAFADPNLGLMAPIFSGAIEIVANPPEPTGSVH